MPQLSKISQRRLLLDQFYAKILIMPSTESERCRPPILMASKKWSAYRQNWWSAWFRTSGRHPSELMVGMSQNMQLAKNHQKGKDELLDLAFNCTTIRQEH